MRAVKFLLFTLATIVAAIVFVGVFLPSSVRVESTLQMDAPIQDVFAQVVDLQKNPAWNPWGTRDTTMTYSFGDHSYGEGASYSWTSQHSGSGTLTIVSVTAPVYIATDLDFGSMGQARGYWEFAETETGTQVTWGFTDSFGWNIADRYFGLMLPEFLGADFDTGLEKMRAIVQAQPSQAVTETTGLPVSAATELE